jgi:hypothetical protein
VDSVVARTKVRVARATIDTDNNVYAEFLE